MRFDGESTLAGPLLLVLGVLVTAYQAYKGKPVTPPKSEPTEPLTNPISNAFSLLGDRISGVIMAIALPPAGLVTLGADPNLLIFKNIRVIGTLVGTMQDTAATLEYARRGLLKQIREVRGMERFAESVQELRQGEIAGRVVIEFDQE